MLTKRTRRNVSLVLFVSLLLVSAVVWSMGTVEDGMKDGVYSGTAKGFKDMIVADVTISGGVIADIQVAHEDTPAIADPAIETLIEQMLELQSADVEIVSGATFTSKAVIESVAQAITKASVDYKDGVHVGEADGFGGPLKVEVTVSQGAITNIVVIEDQETPFIAGNAFEQLPAAMIAAQSWDVEIVSGATVTSEAMKQAVEKALTE